MRTRVVVAMPAYNEAEGLQEFLNEIIENVRTDVMFVVIDDNSSDNTFQILQELGKTENLVAFRNQQNLGHGQSTLIALRKASEFQCDYVISVDGDGQFRGEDIKKIISIAIQGNYDVVEGVRTHRIEPMYRKIPSIVTRIIVLMKSGKFPKDGNTPLRLYRKSALARVLMTIDRNIKVPNVYISSLVRKNDFSIMESSVVSLQRRGHNKVGTMWKTKNNWLPSRRFIRFCILSFIQIIALRIPTI